MDHATRQEPRRVDEQYSYISFSHPFLFLKIGVRSCFKGHPHPLRLLRENMKRSSKVDRISYLPIHILSCILSYLPVEEACGTSILSHQWKQIWSSMPVLDLEIDTFSEGVSDEAPSHRSEWGLVHDKDGPILRFQLLESMICCLLDLEQWIGILENMGTLEPDCILCCVTPYELPASLFSLTSLVSLELWRCEVEPPPAFQGFSFLKFLSLECVTVSNEMLESLVSNSKVLESLRVVNCYDLKIIKFDAPSLLSLYLQGEFHDLDVSVNSNLNNLAIYWLSHGVPSIRLQGLVKLESLCFNGWIPDVVMAEDDESRIHSCFSKSISSYFKPKPWLCCLKRLEMKARFIEEIQVAEFFLLNSPALQVLSLHIKLPKKEETKSKLMERWALIPKASPEATFILT
ncbi:hypothetical protein AMTRI_Chr09g16020 [Amborella trichopoda]|nr:F-box/FBD/LRR-repeat protein At1g13570 [Amborella trichopoda]XP_020517353.1 F-box/FBD/LRR-repeat protein At1g13570 [Amborella trichopoda]XP_020517354.1 F-box/FBD/LRR-repeat protein At1g13570 [Amborella trichopoda]XP_020517355.1 F-box/FBD/LRR-repeat protein At1g13570 [Amborella trichopoda]XP_020517357.1 F-box/FBD/LRR-repeat protein At1g13570 [Amborella trichopoda]XP_020517358.1 F-box/FBD/LRR-repeat protein At1g13570 [Amborella trichopoda]XP_020517359.1 F-box/FBD/LRR-repeat protein At1g13570|eukprot:XP_020517352.1 F-box/FBD/LRR-repeat protein At1g13570 [Amborella trichopoda]